MGMACLKSSGLAQVMLFCQRDEFCQIYQIFFCLTCEIPFPSKTTELFLHSYDRVQKNMREADDCWISSPEVNRQGLKIG